MSNVNQSSTPTAQPVTAGATPPVSNWTPKPRQPMSGAKLFFITLAAVVLGPFIFLILLFMLLGTLGAAAGGGSTISEPIVLELDLRQPLQDSPSQPSLFAQSPASIVGIVRSLERAAEDDQVEGLFIRAGSTGIVPATAEELRMAILEFKESGKFVISHAQGLNSTSVVPFQAISASDEIWLQASTSLAMAGIYAQSEFLGGTMEKIGAQPQFFRHGDYKTAVNTYTEKTFTPEQRESTESLMNSIFKTVTANIAEDRDLTKAELMRLLESAPHAARDAQSAGLIDKLGYLEEARDYIATKAGDDDTVFQSITEYDAKTNAGKPVIAVVTAQGTILPGTIAGSPFGTATGIGGDSTSAVLDDVLDNDKVQAVVLRVSSPGGSAAASDQIMAAAKRVQDSGKPIVVSMGQYAASGGYYIAAPADHIVALPQTITGSIGVYGGKIALEDAFAKVGYNLEAITIGGDYAGAYNADEPFNQAQAAGYQREMDQIYADFVGVVADGRNMSREAVIAVAEGRVWTGEQALANGLVDELGGFKTAVAAAKRLAEIDEDDAVRLRFYPKPKTQGEIFEELFEGSAEAGASIEQLTRVLGNERVQALIDAGERVSAQMDGARREVQADLPTFD